MPAWNWQERTAQEFRAVSAISSPPSLPSAAHRHLVNAPTLSQSFCYCGMYNTKMANHAPDPLCEFCAKIDFDPRKLNALPGNPSRWNLGGGARVMGSSCPFCKLVSYLMLQDRLSVPHHNRKTLSELRKVTVLWYKDGGPGGRGAFAVDGFDNYHCICFGHDPSGPANMEDRYMRLDLKPLVDLSTLFTWLSACSAKHQCALPLPIPAPGSKSGSVLVEDVFPGLDHLRFIDVNRHCLVKVTTMQKYVALSYVWGTALNCRLTKGSEAALSADGGLLGPYDKVYRTLPRTVRDAIALVRGLGLSYLWVDALCLVQNDMKDLGAGIAFMDEVYQRAFFTIVAAAGHGADAGLAGVQPDSRRASQLCVKVTPDAWLGLYTPLGTLLRQSVYSTRGWTYVGPRCDIRLGAVVTDDAYTHCTDFKNSCYRDERCTLLANEFSFAVDKPSSPKPASTGRNMWSDPTHRSCCQTLHPPVQCRTFHSFSWNTHSGPSQARTTPSTLRQGCFGDSRQRSRVISFKGCPLPPSTPSFCFNAKTRPSIAGRRSQVTRGPAGEGVPGLTFQTFTTWMVGYQKRHGLCGT